ncbi:MAG: sugar phosphate isomerase/epimerase [Kiritimatiellae bacterium]|nr:sugar phosphate isomerase/epimerase [Kiritimatiellia bacterium]
MTTRRSFFKSAGLGIAATATAPALINLSAAAAESSGANTTFKLGIAGYTFAKFNLEEALKMTRKVDVTYLCIKDFHLPLACTPEEVTAFHAKCKEYGVIGYGCGPIYMETAEAAKTAFEYTKRVGVKTLVGVPFKKGANGQRVENQELLELINDLVQEYDIKYAIHNHGPDMPELFPSAESCIARIKDMDQRVGICLDIGHQLRDGKDPVKAILDHHERLHDMHIKNVTEPTKKGRGIEMPRGAIDMTAVVNALRKVQYRGVCSLEYEKDMQDPILGIAESIGYFRGIMDATR